MRNLKSAVGDTRRLVIGFLVVAFSLTLGAAPAMARANAPTTAVSPASSQGGYPGDNFDYQVAITNRDKGGKAGSGILTFTGATHSADPDLIVGPFGNMEGTIDAGSTLLLDLFRVTSALELTPGTYSIALNFTLTRAARTDHFVVNCEYVVAPAPSQALLPQAPNTPEFYQVLVIPFTISEGGSGRVPDLGKIDEDFFTGIYSLDYYFQENSFNKFRIDGDITPLYNYIGPKESGTIEWLEAQAAGDGYDLSQYDLYYFITEDGSGGGAGNMRVYGWAHRAIDRYGSRHEIAHTIGIGHSNTLDEFGDHVEYGDLGSVMGGQPAKNTQLHGMHKLYAGWIEQSRMRTITSSGTYSLYRTEDWGDGVSDQLLKIVDPNTLLVYYVGFRFQVGFDANLGTSYLDGTVYPNRLHIHRNGKINGTGSNLETTLADGETWEHGAFSVKLLSHDDEFAQVQVEILQTPPPPPTINTPIATASPDVNQGGPIGTPREYTLSVSNMDTGSTIPGIVFFDGLSYDTNALTVSHEGFTGKFPMTARTISPIAAGGIPDFSGDDAFTVTSLPGTPPGDYPIVFDFYMIREGESASTFQLTCIYTVTSWTSDITSPAYKFAQPGTAGVKSVISVQNDFLEPATLTQTNWSADPELTVDPLGNMNANIDPGMTVDLPAVVMTSAPGIADGIYKVYLDFTLVHGVQTEFFTAEAEYWVDGTPPTNGTNLQAVSDPAFVNKFSWTRGTDPNSWAWNYYVRANIYRDGVYQVPDMWGVELATTWGDPNALPGVTYTYTVESLDVPGNINPNPVSIVMKDGVEVIQLPPVNITTTSLPDGSVGSNYSQILAATGGDDTYTWTLTGSLPAGLTHVNGVISGTPTTAESQTFTVRTTDGAGSWDEQILTITVVDLPLSITTTSLPDGTRNTAYSVALQATSGDGSYAWSKVSGKFPAGMNMNSSGVISGKPKKTGTFNFTVRVTDGSGATADQNLSLTVNP